MWTRIASVITVVQLLGAVFLLFSVTNLLHRDTTSSNCLRGDMELYACLLENFDLISIFYLIFAFSFSFIACLVKPDYYVCK